MRIMEMAHLTDIQTAKVGIVLLLLQILAIITQTSHIKMCLCTLKIQ